MTTGRKDERPAPPPPPPHHLVEHPAAEGALSQFLTLSCVGPIYVFLGSQINSLVTTCYTTWSKGWEFEKPKLKDRDNNTVTPALKVPLLKSNVAFRYKELSDATSGFNKKCLIGTGGFAKVFYHNASQHASECNPAYTAYRIEGMDFWDHGIFLTVDPSPTAKDLDDYDDGDDVCIGRLQVYKATLPDSRVVAVKKLLGRGKQSDREFRAEIETVGKVHHPHLVQLLGYCRTKEGKLLVYEYFENGSLNRYMRRGKEMHLDWDTRLKIALGAAEGLAYLHNCEPRIIHRDVKASNILLDKNYDAKVSDFGLARLIDPAKTHVTTFIAGTKAYIAPEYQKSLRLTIKCDVYSYGVVLLELLTGKDPSMGRNFDLITWVKRRMSSCYEFFDVRMLESGHDKDAMTKVLDLALQCTKTSPSQRPTMDEVVILLKSLRRSQEPDEDTYEPPATIEADDERNANEPRDVILTESDAGSVTSEATDDDVFPSKGLDIAFERPYFPRVVSTPVLGDVAKQTENTRAVVSIGDVRVESHMLGLESQSSDVSSASSDEKLSQDSSTSSLPNNNQFVRCESFS